MRYASIGIYKFFACVFFLIWTPLGAQESASNFSYSGDEQESYRQFQKLASFKGYVFRDLRNHKVVSKLEYGVPDRENNAYLEATGLKTFSVHIDELPPGQFNTKHRGPVEGVIYILSGHGYTILQPYGEKEMRIDWKEGDLISIPANSWHQNFNLDKENPARVLGVGNGGLIGKLGIPRLPDLEDESYSQEYKDSLRKEIREREK